MQIKTMVANVEQVLRRPDLRTQIEQRVRGAVLWAHKSEYFVRDRVTSSQIVQNPDQLMRMALPPYFRQFELLRPMDSTGTPIGLSTDTPDDLGYREIDPRTLKAYRGQDERNYYYVAGDVINICSEVAPHSIYFIYYALPDLRSEEAVTWITEQYQELIEFRALSVLYSIIGNQDLRNTYAQLAAEHLEQLKDNAFQAGAAQ